jgi:hypothetical protein
MKTLRKLQQYVVIPVILSFVVVTFPFGAAQAGMVSTERAVERSYQAGATADRERVLGLLRRAEVQQEMRALGVDPDEAYARAAALSDAELAQVAGRMDALPAGEGIIGPIVGAAVLVFIVLLITDLMCWTRVFPFTKCVAR